MILFNKIIIGNLLEISEHFGNFSANLSSRGPNEYLVETRIGP